MAEKNGDLYFWRLMHCTAQIFIQFIRLVHAIQFQANYYDQHRSINTNNSVVKDLEKSLYLFSCYYSVAYTTKPFTKHAVYVCII